MKSSIGIYFLCAILPTQGIAEQPADAWLQLSNINRASQQQLAIIHHLSDVHRAPRSPEDKIAQERLNNKQRFDQQWLQEIQRRRQAAQKQRLKIINPGMQDRMKSNIQLQQFRHQQQNQLSRFRMQQLMGRKW